MTRPAPRAIRGASPESPTLFDAVTEAATGVAAHVSDAVTNTTNAVVARAASPASRVGRTSSARSRAARRVEPVSDALLPADEDTAVVPAESLVPGASAGAAISVSLLTQTARDVVEGAFPPVWVRGEISDFKAHRNGHWYFSLRDAAAQVRCVVWARDQRAMPAAPDDGMQVTAFGQLGVYAARGEMQFSIRAMAAEGDGLWRKALEQTRLRLAADGLLAPGRKRALPRYPRRIAMVTSASGAALRDVIAVLRRRAPGVELYVVHAAVQGESAPRELCEALDRVARWGGADVVIVGRGGGSREDLWAFNDERVARALAACPVPTISAVGHEVDITLCDLVADLRAATPSAAAEHAVASRAEVGLALDALRRRLLLAIDDRVSDLRTRAARCADTLGTRTMRRVADQQRAIGMLASRIHALSPLATLSRGYAVPTSPDGRTLVRADDFRAGEPFCLRVLDGEVQAVTRGVRPVATAP